jgi:hypothetical protein
MAQHDFNIANAGGATVRADINNALAAIQSSNSGTSAPSSTVAGMLWLDTSGGLPYALKIRDGGNNHWLTIGTVNDPGSDGNMSVSAIEGTAVLSTGESGGSKFLREDGDGSCSWQSADTDFATFAQVRGTSTTATISAGSNAMTVASSTGISNGDFVVAEGITQGTTVTSGAGSTSLVLSANAGVALSSRPVEFYSATKSLSPGLVGGMLCRAWINFYGAGTVDIRACVNVSSITDNYTGNYYVNFTTAMQDVNYATNFSAGSYGSAGLRGFDILFDQETTRVRVEKRDSGGSEADAALACVTVFR